MVLGVFPENAYEQGELTLEPGDRLVFYTDGITEARSAEGEEYGEDRLAAAAASVRTESAESMKDALLADVNGFTAGKFDDGGLLLQSLRAEVARRAQLGDPDKPRPAHAPSPELVEACRRWAVSPAHRRSRSARRPPKPRP